MITLTSDSIDELNQLYRQLKNSYQAMDTIKINPEGLQYTLKLEKKSLNPVIKNLLDKILDWCDDELSEFVSFTPENLDQFLREIGRAHV